MRFFIYSIIYLLLSAVPLAAVADTIPEQPSQTGDIDSLMEQAMARGLIAGAVVLIGDNKGNIFERAYGRISIASDARAMTLETVFDLASLTKVVATTPAILKLAEEGKLSLLDPVTRWFPEFAGKGKDDLLVLNLLTHTSGLDDFPLSSAAPLQSAIDGVAGQRLKGEIGSRFRYADINFILLGEMIHRATGQGVDRYAERRFFSPLGMMETRFNPDNQFALRCSATIGANKTLLTGHVQDYPARQLGGIAGHAGLFGTAHDLARFCRMILGEGLFAGHRVLSPRAVRQMTAPYFSRSGKVIRGLGWDIASPYSSPRGMGFSEVSFGHTGYSGTSIWIDPAIDAFVVLLTARLEYKRVKEFSRLRSDLSTLAARMFVADQEPAEIY
jgi:CubicO group peptidase (beta-lactamase class C family)